MGRHPSSHKNGLDKKEADERNCSDHFDQKVEASLRRDLPIVTTPHAKSILTSKGEDSFTRVSSVEVYEQLTVDIKHNQNDAQRQRRPKLRITGMPGKHIPVGKPLEKLNELVGAVCYFLHV